MIRFATIQRLGQGLGLAVLLSACSFQPGGGATADVDAVISGGDDAPADVDAPSPIDARVIDAPSVSIDAAMPDVGVIRAAALTATANLDGMATELGSSMRYAMDLGGPGHRDLVAGYAPSMRAELRAGHDATYLYLLFEVIEAKPHQGDSTSTWQNDAITFYIDAADDRAGAYGADDHEVIIDYRPVYGIYPSTNGADPTIEAVRLPTDDGFTVEVRLPRAALGAAVGNRIGFAWGVYDDDGGGDAEGYGLWYERPGPRCATCCTGEAHAEAWCDTTMLGELVFAN